MHGWGCCFCCWCCMSSSKSCSSLSSVIGIGGSFVMLESGERIGEASLYE